MSCFLRSIDLRLVGSSCSVSLPAELKASSTGVLCSLSFCLFCGSGPKAWLNFAPRSLPGDPIESFYSKLCRWRLTPISIGSSFDYCSSSMVTYSGYWPLSWMTAVLLTWLTLSSPDPCFWIAYRLPGSSLMALRRSYFIFFLSPFPLEDLGRCGLFSNFSCIIMAVGNGLFWVPVWLKKISSRSGLLL